MVGSRIVAGSGSGPTERENSWYSPGPIATPLSAVQVTSLTASVSVVPYDSTGLASFAFVAAAVQPGTGLVLTYRNGVSCGSLTVSFTVPAVADSLGTRKVSALNPPLVGLSGVTRTWAEAVAAGSRASPAVASPASTSRDRRRRVGAGGGMVHGRSFAHRSDDARGRTGTVPRRHRHGGARWGTP